MQTESINHFYGFREECTRSWGPRVGLVLWQRMNETFGLLPLAATIWSGPFQPATSPFEEPGGWAGAHPLGWRVAVVSSL